MLARRGFLLNQLGDTIVEVMVVLAILGLAIGISYATANRSLLNARQAQENSVATQLAQSQIESLRNLVNGPDNIFLPAGTVFCINNDQVIKATDSEFTDDCTGIQTYYKLQVLHKGADTFNVTVTWPDVRGEGDDTVTLAYRLHKP